ncbi:MAG: low molecular weight phosphotyrosine protein phosphatase [Bacteroidales bacterium]|nr:low molecular weight phosphotyrosine protein phosphatase [Bacteroidales bacterium]
MKILFLCNSNLCRSPLAEGVMKLILKNRNIEATVDSAGFEAFHINESPEARAVMTAKKYGIDISSKRARLFNSDDFDRFDKIFVMDTFTYRNAIDFARNENDIAKIDFLMNLVRPGRNESIPDPFYRKLEACQETYLMMEQACNKIADSMSSQILH